MNTNIKIIVASVSLAASVSAWSAMSGLSVRSHLGEPFSGSVTVSGDEAKALMEGGRVSVSGSGIRGSISKNSNGTVTVRLRSAAPVHEPVLSFTVSAGQQTREYTAILDPVRYSPPKARTESPKRETKPKREQDTKTESKSNRKSRSDNDKGVKVPITQDFIKRDKKESTPTTKQDKARSTESRVANKSQNEQPRTHSGASAKVKKPTKTAVTPRRHRAHAGEKLADIAARYRPRNMSQQAAMRALMMANPRAFRHGTTIRRSATLYIPTESQWHVYAQRAQQAAQTKAPVVRRPAQKAATVATPAAPTKQTAPSATIEESVMPTPATPPKAAPNAVPEPQMPEVNDNGSAVSEILDASAASVDNVTPETQDSASATVLPASAASNIGDEVDASAVSVSVAEEAVVPPSVVSDEENSAVAAEGNEDSDNNMLLIGGGIAGGAALLLGAGGALWWRRRHNQGRQNANQYDGYADEGNFEDDDEGWEDDGLSPAARAKKDLEHSRTAIQTSDAGSLDAGTSEYVAEEDDGIFFGEDTPATAYPDADNDFNLDGFDVDKQPVEQTAPSNLSDDDWSWLEGAGNTEAQTQAADNDDLLMSDEGDWTLDDTTDLSVASPAVAQPTSESEFVVDEGFGDFGDLMSEHTEAPAESSSVDNLDALTAAAFDDLGDFGVSPTSTDKPTDKPTVSSDDFGLGDLDMMDFDVSKPSTTVQSSDDDLDLLSTAALEDLGDFGIPDMPATPVSTPATSSLDDMDFSGLEGLDDFVTDTSAPKQAASTSQTLDLDSLSLDALNNDMGSLSEPSTASNLDDILGGFDMSDIPSAPTAEPQASTASSLDDMDFSGLDGFDMSDIPSAPTAEPQASTASSLDDMDFSGLDGFDMSDIPSAPTAEPQASTASSLDDMDFSGLDGFDMSDIPSAPTAEPQASTASSLDDMDFSGLDGFDMSDIPSAPAAEPQASTASSLDDTDFSGLDGFEDEDKTLELSAVTDEVVPSHPTDLDFSSLDGFNSTLDDLLAEPAPKKRNEFNPSDDLDTLAAQALGDLEGLDAPVAELNKAAVPSLDDMDFSSLDAFVSDAKTTPADPVVSPDEFDVTTSVDGGLNDLDNFDVSDIPVAQPEPVREVAPSLDNLDFSGLDDLLADKGAETSEPNVSVDNHFDLEETKSDLSVTETPKASTERTNPLSLLDKKLADKLTDLNIADALTAAPTTATTAKLVVDEEPALTDNAEFGLDSFDVSATDSANHVEMESFDDFGLDAVDRVLDAQQANNPDLDVGNDDWLNDTGNLEVFDDFDMEPVANTVENFDNLESFDADWEDDGDIGSNAGVGFVSGAVGTEEPFEAKLELAKMYVDVEDYNAARETFTELVAETTGEIKAEAERWLAKLDS